MNTLSNEEKAEGWRLLFDGYSTAGWHGYNKTIIGDAWRVEDGVLFFDPAQQDGRVPAGSDIVTDQVFSDFHLKIDWKISVKGNSGIMFHVQEDQRYTTPWVTGPEMQVLDNEGHKDGNIIRHRAGDLYDLIECSRQVAKEPGEWNEAAIICHEATLVFILNNEKVVSTTLWDDAWRTLVAGSKFKDLEDFAKHPFGRIALQDHGDPVWFRNIKIKGL